jgi:hypothetical protein
MDARTDETLFLLNHLTRSSLSIEECDRLVNLLVSHGEQGILWAEYFKWLSSGSQIHSQSGTELQIGLLRQLDSICNARDEKSSYRDCHVLLMRIRDAYLSCVSADRICLESPDKIAECEDFGTGVHYLEPDKEALACNLDIPPLRVTAPSVNGAEHHYAYYGVRSEPKTATAVAGGSQGTYDSANGRFIKFPLIADQRSMRAANTVARNMFNLVKSTRGKSSFQEVVTWARTFPTGALLVRNGELDRFHLDLYDRHLHDIYGVNGVCSALLGYPLNAPNSSIKANE